MNGQYIKKMDISKLTDMIIPFLSDYDLSELSREKLEKMVEITREPLTTLKDIQKDVPYFFGEDVPLDEVKELLTTELSKNVLNKFMELAQKWDFNNEQELHDDLQKLRDDFKANFGYKPKETMWAIRAAVTGRTRGADMVGILTILGKDKVLRRIKNAMNLQVGV